MSATDYAHLYRDGQQWVAVLTGMPHEAVQVGVGDTREAALASLEATAIQSCGPDSGEASALRWAEGAGWIDDASSLESADEDDHDEDATDWGCPDCGADAGEVYHHGDGSWTCRRCHPEVAWSVGWMGLFVPEGEVQA